MIYFLIKLFFKEMTTTIKFNDNIEHQYNSFDEITQLDNYDEIVYIDCYNNNLSSLPQLPNSLEVLSCKYNNLSSLPQLSNSLKDLYCNNNNLSNLPQLPNSLKELYCYDDPIYDYIAKYFNNDWKKYREFQHKIHNMTMKVFANKIGDWYLECKYNPEYKVCQKRLKIEFNELYCES